MPAKKKSCTERRGNEKLNRIHFNSSLVSITVESHYDLDPNPRIAIRIQNGLDARLKDPSVTLRLRI